MESVLYRMLPELNLKGVFPAFFMLAQILQWKEFKYYFFKNNVANYQRIDQTFLRNQIFIAIWKEQVQQFCNEKYSLLDDFSYAEVLVFYIRRNESSKTCDYQSDELDYIFIENNN